MSRRSDDWPKRIFLFSLALAVLVGAFVYGVLAQRHWLPPVPQFWLAVDTVPELFTTTDDGLSFHLQPSRGQGDGVTIDHTADDGALVLLAGFFDGENQARLIERDGTVVRAWSLDYFEHFPDPAARPCDLRGPLFVDTHGALVTPRGELVFNYEYCGTLKLDACGEVIWALDRNGHHSVVRAERGGYWLLGRKEWLASEAPDRFPPFSTPATDATILEDTIVRIGEDGEVLDEISIPEVMRANGLEALLTANGEDFNAFAVTRTELVHANKVAELASAVADSYPLFAAGDLAISMRELNLVMVIDPETETVKWHQTGPWLRQHDPEFRPDGRLSIFNNNVYRSAYIADQTVLSTPRKTNIIAIDPVTRRTEVLFGERPGQEMLSVIRGQHELLADDGILITEFDAGRVLEVAADGRIVWEYVNRYDDDFVGEVSNAAVYPAGYFEGAWQACPS